MGTVSDSPEESLETPVFPGRNLRVRFPRRGGVEFSTGEGINQWLSADETVYLGDML